MAACMRLPLQLPKVLPPFRNQKLIHTEAAAKEPAYPPIVPSLTAKSKSARLRQIQERVDKIRAAPVDEKLSLVTLVPRMKFVVYPQTFARNVDKWYQHFTKTAYIPGLPEHFAPAAQQSSPTSPADGPASALGLDDAAFTDIRALVTRVILHELWHKAKKRPPFLYRHQEMLVGPFLRNLLAELTYSLCKYNPLLQLSSLGMIFILFFYWKLRKNISQNRLNHARLHKIYTLEENIKLIRNNKLFLEDFVLCIA